MRIKAHLISENGFFPNNPLLPVLIYYAAFQFSDREPIEEIKETFYRNNWFRPWVDSIYDFHHYHSNNHEVLAIASGTCTVLIGGDNGQEISVEAGDALVLPAGVAHKKVKSSNDFVCVGAYSLNIPYNMLYGKQEEKEAAEQEIKPLPLPLTDPLLGPYGPLIKHWHFKNTAEPAWRN